MKKRIVILTLIGMIILTALAACGTEETLPTPTPTIISPGEVALTMIMQKADAEATQMMVNVQLTATGQIVNATATAQAYQFGIATAEQARKDAQATEQRRRDDRATEQAREDAQATAEQGRKDTINTQSALATATWVVMTQTAIPPHATLTQQAIIQEQIIAANKVELSNLEVERQRKSNILDALWKYAAATAAIITAILVAIRFSRTREIKNEETGVIEAVLLDNEMLIRPQLLPSAVLDLSGKQPSAPQLTDAANQAEIVRRSQGVDAIRAIPQGVSPQVLGDVLGGILGKSEPAPRFEILDANEAPPAGLLDTEALKSLDQDWKEADHA